MLGGGVFVTQNKVLPGSYINIVNASSASSSVGERGSVAIALPLGKSTGSVIELTRGDFVKNSENILGFADTANEVAALREIFLHSNKVYVYDLGTDDDKTATDVINALESYNFNVLCVYTDSSSDVTLYIEGIKTWRDDMGKKCQAVVYNQSNADYEGIINVISTVSNENVDSFILTAWVAGAEAGCGLNQSCTNMLYDGEFTIVVDKTQAQLETCIQNGQIVFHNVYGEIRLLEDINSLITVTEDKGEDFKSNQTIRVIDQIANDIAKLFNTKYLGKIPNNASGRVSLWGDIVAHHRRLEEIQAIENFDSSLVTVEQGDSKKSVVVTDVITVVNSMAQLYMTVIVQ